MTPLAWLLIGFWCGVAFSAVATVVITHARRAEAWGERLADYADALDEPVWEGPSWDRYFESDSADLEPVRRVAPQVIVRRGYPGRRLPNWDAPTGPPS
jgi:hypothetical protein